MSSTYFLGRVSSGRPLRKGAISSQTGSHFSCTAWTSYASRPSGSVVVSFCVMVCRLVVASGPGHEKAPRSGGVSRTGSAGVELAVSVPVRPDKQEDLAHGARIADPVADPHSDTAARSYRVRMYQVSANSGTNRNSAPGPTITTSGAGSTKHANAIHHGLRRPAGGRCTCSVVARAVEQPALGAEVGSVLDEGCPLDPLGALRAQREHLVEIDASSTSAVGARRLAGGRTPVGGRSAAGSRRPCAPLSAATRAGRRLSVSRRSGTSSATLRRRRIVTGARGAPRPRRQRPCRAGRR